MRVDRDQVVRHRLRATHLHSRLPAGALPDAARGGLQDSAPRAGVISLYARADGVGPDSWEDPSLAQIWFRGGADYIVPREDIGVFTLGSSPRDQKRMRALEDIAGAAHDVLQGAALEVREVQTALRLDEPFLIRVAAVTGRLLIRWNASRIWLVPNERPVIDAEEARVELARRFVRWFAPVTRDQFRKWTGVEASDARLTWGSLTEELEPVEVEGERRYVLAEDADALARGSPVEGVRLIPHSDPFIKIDPALVVPDRRQRLEIFPEFRNKPAFWPVSGGLLVDGALAGSWARQQRRVTVNPWRKLGRAAREAIEREALGFPIAARSKAEVIWNA